MSKNKKIEAKVKIKKSAPYPYEKFVAIWSRSNSVAEVAAATKLKKATVSATATKLRKNKVQLKLMPRRVGRSIDPSALNKIVKASSATAAK